MIKNLDYTNTMNLSSEEQHFIDRKYDLNTLKSVDLAILQYDVCINVNTESAESIQECIDIDIPFMSSIEMDSDTLLVLFTSFQPIDNIYRTQIYELIDESYYLHLQTKRFRNKTTGAYYMMCAVTRGKKIKELSLKKLFKKHKIIHPKHTIYVDHIPRIVSVGIKNKD